MALTAGSTSTLFKPSRCPNYGVHPIQHKGGTFAAFKRFVAEILAPLRSFFEATKHEYMKFNYLGEWHSHPSFELLPSGPDHATMYEIVTDRKLGALFVALLLVKLDGQGQLESKVTVYQPGKKPSDGIVVHERPTIKGQNRALF